MSSCFFKTESLIFQTGKYEFVFEEDFEYPYYFYQEELDDVYINDMNIEIIGISKEDFIKANGLNVIQNRVNNKFYKLNINISFSGNEIQQMNFVCRERLDDKSNSYYICLYFDENIKCNVEISFQDDTYKDSDLKNTVHFASIIRIYFQELLIDNNIINDNCIELPGKFILVEEY